MTILRRRLVFLTLVAAIVSGFGCASSRRMLDVSVFSEGNERLTDERVNLFPLYYANRQKHSVLWPIGDWDDHGFAIRPLINKQDDDYSVLFPLSSWNTKDGDGWALTSWWDKFSFSVLPIGGKGCDWWFAGPLVRCDTLSKDPGTVLVPVAYWDKERVWVLNSWWSKDSKGFLPVFEKGRTWWAAGPWIHFDDGANFVLPLAYWDRHSLWLGEIFYGQNRDVGGYAKWRSVFGLMAFGETTSKGREWWALPLLTYHDRQGENLTHVTFPLWWQSDSAQAHSRTLFPLWHQQSNAADGFSCWITPLAGFGSNRAGDTHLLNLFGPLYWDYHSPKQRIINVAGLYDRIGDAHYVLFGLGKVQTNEQGTRWRAWPLACGAVVGPGMSAKADGFLQSSSLFWHGANDKQSSWHCWPLLAWGEHSPNYQDSNFLLGLLGDTHQADPGNGSSRDEQHRLIYRTEHTRPLPGKQNGSWVAQPNGSVVTSDTFATLLTHYQRETHQQLPQRTRPADDAWVGLGHWLMCPQGPTWKTSQDIPWQWCQNTRYNELPGSAKSHKSRSVPYPSAREIRATLATMGVKNLPAAAELASVGTRQQDRQRLEKALLDSAVIWDTSLRRFDPLLTLWQRSEEREGDGQAVKDEALWGLLWNYKRNPNEASFRLLWRMYERQQEGQGKQATVRRNIFPFLRWDSSPDKSHISWLWDMFDWHTSKDNKSGGHILFVPWGHADE